MEKVKKQGRPKLPEGQHKEYQRIAVYPTTYKVIKERTLKDGVLIMDYIDRLVKSDNN